MLAFAGAGSVAAAVATSSGNAVSTTISVKPSHAGGSAGALERTVRTRGYTVTVRLAPNSSTAINEISVRLRRGGRDASARIRLTTTMATMAMGYTGSLAPAGAGRYRHTWPPLGMRGTWRLRLEISPRAGRDFAVTLSDAVG